MTLLKWFTAREAADIGAALADQFAAAATQPSPARGPKGNRNQQASALAQLHQRADQEVRPLSLNFYQKARFANSFKWKLIENGVQSGVADGITQSLIMHLFGESAGVQMNRSSTDAPKGGTKNAAETHALLARAEKALKVGDNAQAASLYEQVVSLAPGRAEVLSLLGMTLYNLGRYQEAVERYREAIDVDPENIDALVNLAVLLQTDPEAAEPLLRRALKINPKYRGARALLGLVLLSSGREHEATAAFRKALKASPRDHVALLGLAQIARVDGRFEEAQSLLKRTLEISPKMPTAWASLNGTRKMTVADSDWFATAEEIARSGVPPSDEAQLRFAMGKYCDDIKDYDQAFANFRRGNELLRSMADGFDRKAYASYADDLIRVHSREILAPLAETGSDSAKPVFVLGMPRSGTSLTEQIIASHPSAAGVGESDYWVKVARANHEEIRQKILGLSTRKRLAEEYLRLIERRFPRALRIVDKTPANADLVGLIHSALPRARIIWMRRDPIDTCLSCYFQNFSTSQTFTMELGDLADYYRTHHRLMSHWNSVLAAGAILEVPYEGLVNDQEAWTRKILDFLGLDWDKRCLTFHETKRAVVTASAWQVRQKIYRHSMERWRNYEKFIGPLKRLTE